MSLKKRGNRTQRLGIPILALLITLALAFWHSSRTHVESFVAGLNQPRGMAFDDAGNLYIVEAGLRDAQADERSSPSINHSSRVMRIASDGRMSTILDGLPFTHYDVAGDVGGADVSILAGNVYVLTGEGYDDQLSRAVLRAIPGRPPQRVANLFSFAFATTPIADQMASGAPPSNPYAMLAAPDGQTFYVTDGASGLVLSVKLDGSIRVFATLPNMAPLTGLAFGPDEQLYVAMFSALPLGRSRGAIWAVDANRPPTIAAAGLTMPIDVAFDAAGRMYVLEFSDGQQPYAPGRGRLLRIAEDGSPTVVLDRLNYPTAMIFSRAGDLYIAVNGAFSAPGQGAILKAPCHELDASQACPRHSNR